VSDEIADIIPRPPSSPIASTMLIVSTLGLILSIAIVWTELFGEYLPTLAPGQQPDPEMVKHPPRAIAEKHIFDHYGADYPGSDDMLAAVERDLGLSSTVGDPTAGPGASDMGSSEAPSEAPVETPEAPSEEGGGEGE
jgi:hypothetical protein